MTLPTDVHDLPLRVRYAECDMQGHAFNSHYLTWFDMAHTEALRVTVGSYQDVVERGIELVVAEAHVRYRRPVGFDDEVVVGLVIQALGTSSMTSDVTIRRHDEVVTEGSLRHVCVDATTFTKMPWPEWFRAAFGA